jgi:hypothetical protein
MSGMSAAMPFRKREMICGHACAVCLEKMLSIFGDRKREWPGVRGAVAACGEIGRGFVKNRDEKVSGIGGMSAAVPFTKREILA